MTRHLLRLFPSLQFRRQKPILYGKQQQGEDKGDGEDNDGETKQPMRGTLADIQQPLLLIAHLLHDGSHLRRNWQALAV
jgi:hypothetical protein